MTYPLYTTADDLLTYVISTCQEGSPVSGISAESPTTPILLRGVNFLKTWVEQYWSDFATNSVLLGRLNTFLDGLPNQKLAQLVKNSIKRRQQQPDTIVVIIDSSHFPKPILPKQRQTGSPETKEGQGNEVVFKFSDVDPLEVARQLTLMEELLDCAWMKDEKESLSPHVLQMARWSNHVVQWVTSEIVTVKDNLKQRAVTMEKFVQIAHNLEKLNNYNGVKEVLAALQSASIFRLKKTREVDTINQLLSSKSTKTIEHLKKLTGSEFNYKQLRARIHNVDPPLIPFPGVYQGDLVYLDGYEKNILEDDMLNFAKFKKLYSTVSEIQNYQSIPYALHPVSEIQNMIRMYPVLDEDTSYQFSLYCEPRA